METLNSRIFRKTPPRLPYDVTTERGRSARSRHRKSRPRNRKLAPARTCEKRHFLTARKFEGEEPSSRELRRPYCPKNPSREIADFRNLIGIEPPGIKEPECDVGNFADGARRPAKARAAARPSKKGDTAAKWQRVRGSHQLDFSIY